MLDRASSPATPMTFKVDDRGKMIAEVLMKAGYANQGEMFLDLLYQEANRINPSLCLPVVSGIKEQKDALSRELLELQNLIHSQPGVV